MIAGAARGGTSYLAAQLGAHPKIDPGSLKEPNFFSRNFERGFDWYDGLFQPRTDGVLRMDASVSYTFPHFPQALDRLAEHGSDTLVVYVVRDPIARAFSHYLHNRHYFKQEPASNFGQAIAANDLYAGASDYQRWLDALNDRFPRERVLVVPFSAVTDNGVDAEVCARLGLAPPPHDEQQADAHKNNVVTFKNEAFRVASRRLRRSRFYPLVRERLGADRLRRLRSLVTREARLPTLLQALASCTAAQRRELHDLELRAKDAVNSCLSQQDQRLGLDWSRYWTGRPTPDRTL